MSKVLVVTPTYNERDNLEPFLAGLHRVAPSVDVLVVDDSSPDGTGALADDIAARDARVRVMHRPAKAGLATAYLDAFRKALADGYEIVFEMDTDLSHDPVYVPDFLAAIDRGADLVIGSRNVPGGAVEGWGPVRHFISKGGSLYSRSILHLPVRDLTSGFKAFRREVLEAIELETVRSQGYAFQIELTYRAIRRGFRVEEVPITFVDRRAGQGKMSRKIFAEAVVMVWKLRLDALRGTI
jgi:dolichol-phosphate mannosyltransferase